MPESWNIFILMLLRKIIRNPSTNHPKSMFQLSGVHCRVLRPKLWTINFLYSCRYQLISWNAHRDGTSPAQSRETGPMHSSPFPGIFKMGSRRNLDDGFSQKGDLQMRTLMPGAEQFVASATSFHSSEELGRSHNTVWGHLLATDMLDVLAALVLQVRAAMAC